MEAFYPFDVEPLANNGLSIKLSPIRKKLQFAVLVAMPVLLFASFLIVINFLKDSGIPQWFYYLYIAFLLISLLVTLRLKMVTEVQIDKTVISQQYFRYFQKKNEDFLVNEVSHIELVSHYGRSSGYRYHLKMNDGRRILMLNVPKRVLKNHHKIEMNEALQKATGLEVKPR